MRLSPRVQGYRRAATSLWISLPSGGGLFYSVAMTNDGSRATKRMLRRSAAGTLTCLLGAMALAACTPADPPASTPTPTAIFASEDEALAAATDVFAGYLAAYDSAMAKGGKDLSGVRDYVGEDYFATLSEPGTIVQNNWHTNGVSTFEVVEVAKFSSTDTLTAIDLNICRDVSAIKVIDSNERNVTPADRVSIVPLTVSFTSPSAEASSVKPLIVSKVESWTASGAC